MKITYQKRNGCIIYKMRKTMLPYKIGDTTSMGWKVLNIEREYKDKYYPIYEYNTLIEIDKQKLLKKKKTTEVCLNEIRTLFYCFMAAMFINILKIFLGI